MIGDQQMHAEQTNYPRPGFDGKGANQLSLKPDTQSISSLLRRPGVIVLLAIILPALFSSCVTTRNTDYFQPLNKDTTLSNFVTNDFENKIQAGDILAIKATSLSAVEDAIFNQGGAETSNSGGQASGGGFLVKENGKISFHRLGEVQAAGLTRKELAGLLREQLQAYMKDVMVSVNFLNHKITILGAVGSPSVIPLQSEQIPLIDALVSSGGITATGKKNDVMIIREEGNQKRVKHVNLEDASIFGTDWYYARPNDIIYVMTDRETAVKAERRSSLQSTIALVASGIGFLLIIIDRIIK